MKLKIAIASSNNKLCSEYACITSHLFLPAVDVNSFALTTTGMFENEK